MMKWIKVDEKGIPVKRNKNSFSPHDYQSENRVFLIVNNSFNTRNAPWVLKKNENVVGRYNALKDAKEAAEKLDKLN